MDVQIIQGQEGTKHMQVIAEVKSTYWEAIAVIKTTGLVQQRVSDIHSTLQSTRGRTEDYD